MTEPNTYPLFASAEAEADLLRSLLLGRRALPPLHPGDFALPAHRLIWRAMVTLAYRRLWIDGGSVAAQLQRSAPPGASELAAAIAVVKQA